MSAEAASARTATVGASTDATPHQRLPAATIERCLAEAVALDGGAVRTWRPRQVTGGASRATAVLCEVEIGTARGSVTTERYVVAEARIVSAERTEPVVWQMADDPLLPGLRATLDGARVGALLRGLGAATEPVRLRLRVYRPTRRAVIEARTGRARVFLRVLPPQDAARVHRLHRQLEEAGLPVAPSHGLARDLGIVVLGALGGDDLRRRLRAGGAPFPPPSEVEELLHRLPSGVGRRRRRSWRHATHAASVAATLPELGERLERLVAALDAAERRVETLPEVTVHGDLHEGQLRIGENGAIVGLLDVDTIGVGRRLDDLGTMLGHLATLELGGDPHGAIRNYLAGCYDAFAREDAARRAELLRAAAAATIVGLATGPHRVQQAGWPEATRARIALAERWLRTEHVPAR